MHNPKKRSRGKMIGWVALAITALVVISILIRVDDWSRDWTTNFAVLDEAAADVRLRPVHLSASPRVVSEQLQQWAERTPRLERRVGGHNRHVGSTAFDSHDTAVAVCR